MPHRDQNRDYQSGLIRPKMALSNLMLLRRYRRFRPENREDAWCGRKRRRAAPTTWRTME